MRAGWPSAAMLGELLFLLVIGWFRKREIAVVRSVIQIRPFRMNHDVRDSPIGDDEGVLVQGVAFCKGVFEPAEEAFFGELPFPARPSRRVVRRRSRPAQRSFVR